MAVVGHKWVRRPENGVDVLRIGGAITAIASVVISLLLLLAVGGVCSAVVSFQLLAFGFLFVAGCIAFLVGTAISFINGRH
jgi:hypothetical protein